jgi:hypothetical protein
VLRNISVAWQRMEGDVRLIKVTGVPRVSYWELQTPNGNFIGVSPTNALGVLAFYTPFSGAARLIPVTLRGTVYREGVSVSAISGGSGGGGGPSGSYSVTPPAILVGEPNNASGSFTLNSTGITTVISVTLSSSLAGSFSQAVISLPIGSATQSFTYTPAEEGSHVISFSSPLTNPSPITYVAEFPAA